MMTWILVGAVLLVGVGLLGAVRSSSPSYRASQRERDSKRYARRAARRYTPDEAGLRRYRQDKRPGLERAYIRTEVLPAMAKLVAGIAFFWAAVAVLAGLLELPLRSFATAHWDALLMLTCAPVAIVCGVLLDHYIWKKNNDLALLAETMRNLGAWVALALVVTALIKIVF
jgi:hypothetical protein